MSMHEELLNESIAVVGEEDIILGFKALGFKTYPIKDLQDFKTILDEVIKYKIGICLVQDYIYKDIYGEIEVYKNSPLPIFIPFSKDKKTEVLDNLIKDIQLRAVGAIF